MTRTSVSAPLFSHFGLVAADRADHETLLRATPVPFENRSEATRASASEFCACFVVGFVRVLDGVIVVDNHAAAVWLWSKLRLL